MDSLWTVKLVASSWTTDAVFEVHKSLLQGVFFPKLQLYIRLTSARVHATSSHPPFFGFGCPGCSCLIENIPVSNLWLQAVGRQCSFCRRLHSDFYCVVVTGVRRRVRRVCWRPGLFVVSQHVWSPQWLVSPTCLRWHVCGKPACLEPASARFSDMFAMSNGSLKRDWRELTARVQN